MYLHPEMETLTRPEIERLQLERLQKTLRQCMRSPFYKRRFDEIGLTPDDIRSLDDLKQSWIARNNTPCIFLSARERINIDKFRHDLYGMVREIHAGRYPFNNFLY